MNIAYNEKNKEGKRIRLVIAINDFSIGGAQKLVLDILRKIDRKKFDVSLLTLFQFPYKNDFYAEVPSDIPVQKFSFGGFLDIASWVSLFRFLHQARPAVVVSNLFFCNTVMRVLKIPCGYSIIAVVHNTYINKTKLQIFTDRLLSRITRKIVAVSRAVAEFTISQEGINPDLFTVILNGIDVSTIRKEGELSGGKDEAKAKIGLNSSDRVIINVARLTPQKNLDLLISAFAIFLKKHLRYKLLILGEGGLKKDLEELIRRENLEGKVIMTGAVKNVPLYCHASDFFVSTSSIEGFSIAHIEALASGLPLLTTRTGGTEEMIKEGANGFFISKPAVSEIVEGLEKMDLADIKTMSKNAAATAVRFDIGKTVDNYEKLIITVARQDLLSF